MNILHRSTGRCHFSARLAALLWLACSACLLVPGPSHADDLPVLPDGQVPNDRRLAPPKDLNGYFPFEVPASKEAWEARAAQLRRRVLVALLDSVEQAVGVGKLAVVEGSGLKTNQLQRSSTL